MKTNDKKTTEATETKKNPCVDTWAHHEEVYERRRPELLALAKELVQPVNADIPTVLAHLRSVEALLAELRPRVEALPEFDVKQYDALPEYGRLLQYTHARYLAVIETSDGLVELNDEGTALRDTLLTDLQALATRGFIPQERVDELRAGQGYRDTGEDLTAISALARSVWGTIAGKTGIGRDELDHAYELGTKIVAAVGLREKADPVRTAVRDERARAFTLVGRAYKQAQRAVGFLCWDEASEGEELLPSLWLTKGSARAKKSGEKEEGEVEGAVAKPVVAAGAGAGVGAGMKAKGGAVNEKDEDPFVPGVSGPFIQSSPFSRPVGE